jgi:hypothetical protein
MRIAVQHERYRRFVLFGGIERRENRCVERSALNKEQHHGVSNHGPANGQRRTDAD